MPLTKCPLQVVSILPNLRNGLSGSDNFEYFRKASGVHTKDGEAQVSTLLYSMGGDADDILLSFSLSEEASKDYAQVKDPLQYPLCQKEDIIFERAKFNMHNQGDKELVDSFVITLYQLTKHCN